MLRGFQEQVSELDGACTCAQGGYCVDQPLGLVALCHKLVRGLAVQRVALVIDYQQIACGFGCEHVEGAGEEEIAEGEGERLLAAELPGLGQTFVGG